MKKCNCNISSDNSVTIVRGTTNILEVDFNYKDVANLDTGTAVLGIKKNPKDEDYILFKQVDYDMNKDYIVFEITPAETEDLNTGTYYYDIGINKNDNFYIIISKATFNIKQNILSREDVK